MTFGNPAAERAAIETTYDGLCTVTEFGTIKDPITKREVSQQAVVLLNQPCALSQSSLPSTNQTDVANEINYDAKLFIAPEIVIMPGNGIHVEQDGMSYKFEQAGEPFIYTTHQEIKLKRVDRA
jgi:hypothetical protein